MKSQHVCVRWFVPSCRVVILAMLASTCLAGSLTPPGAPSPTMKNLDQVEPSIPIESLSGDSTTLYNIKVAGAYHLTGSIKGESGKSGIRVDADNVHIDLRGFTLEGVSGSLEAITAGTYSHCTVENGFVKSWGSIGVLLGWDSVARRLDVSGCSKTGIETGKRSMVEQCNASQNNQGEDGQWGIEAGSYSTVRNCIANANQSLTTGAGGGIRAGTDCQIENNVCSGNSGRTSGGGIGIRAESRAVIRNNVCSGNNGAGTSGGYGISVLSGDAVQILGNTCVSNNSGSSGIALGCGIYCAARKAVVKGNVCDDNQSIIASGHGIFMNSPDAIVSENRCSGNTGKTESYGILLTSVSVGSRIENNLVTNHSSDNVGYGIHVLAQGGCVVRANQTAGNKTNSIVLSNVVGRNYCAENKLGDTTATLAGTNVAGTGDRADVPFF